MKKSGFVRISALAFGSLVLPFLFSTSVAAQSEMEKPQLTGVVTVSVRPEMGQAFDEMIEKEYNPAFIKGGGKQSGVWKYAVGNGFDYVFVQPMENFAAMDEPGPLVKGLGEENLAEFFGKITKMVTGVRSVISRSIPEMSHTGPMNGPPNVAIVINLRAHPGKTSAIEKFVKEHYLPAMKKANATFWASKLAFGGNADEYTFLELHDNFASIDKGPPIGRVLKPAEQEALYAKIPNDAVKSVEVWIAKFQPKLSVMPTAPEASN